MGCELSSEIINRRNQPLSEQLFPNAIHEDTGRQRVTIRRDPLRQLQPATRALLNLDRRCHCLFALAWIGCPHLEPRLEIRDLLLVWIIHEDFSRTPTARENTRRRPIFPGGVFENTSRRKIGMARCSFAGWQVIGKSFMNNSG